MKRVVALSLMVFLAVLLSACAGRENTDQSIVSQNSETTREEQETISQENFFRKVKDRGMSHRVRQNSFTWGRQAFVLRLRRAR